MSPPSQPAFWVSTPPDKSIWVCGIGRNPPVSLRNVIDFGVFVDIGVHQDGLVHISQIVNRRIEKPSDVLEVGQKVQAKILSIDMDQKRIGLSIKAAAQGEDSAQDADVAAYMAQQEQEQE